LDLHLVDGKVLEKVRIDPDEQGEHFYVGRPGGENVATKPLRK